MYVYTPYFSWQRIYLEPQKLVIFEPQLCPINHQTYRGSSNVVVMTLGDTSTHATHMFWEKFVTASWNNINHLAILKYLYLNTLSFQLYDKI